MSNMFNGKLVFVQGYTALPGRGAEFVQGYRSRFLPLMQKRGLRLAGFWQTSAFDGPGDEFFVFWEFDASSEMVALTKALDSWEEGDPDLQAARDDLSMLVSRQEGLTHLGSAESLDIAAQRREGLSLRRCLLEHVDLVPNQHALFEKALRINYLRLLEGSGIRLVGVYRPQLFSIKAVVLWDVEDFSRLSRLDEIESTAEFRHWNNIATTFRTATSGRLLCAC